MGNHRFRLWDMMMPNAWFYKLKDMANLHHHHHHKIASKKPLPPSSSTSSLNNHPPSQNTKSGQRKSYHFTRDLKPHPDSPSERSYSSRRRRSTRRRGRPCDTHPPLVSSSISAGSSFRDDDALEDTTSSCRNCKADLSPRDLPPIITKKQQQEHRSTTTRRYNRNPSSVSSPGVKLRTNSPRIGNLRGRRRSVSESFAVVKSSRDPVKDFRESMVEMIVENNIQGTKELEELLACYLTLNADEYHDLIITVFKQIWFDFIRFRHN